MSITQNEVLEELSKLLEQNREKRPEGFYTRAELIQATGWSARRMSSALTTAKRVGRLEVKRGRAEDVIGRLNWMPLYRIMPNGGPPE
jgi:hypothetical protein